MAFTTFADIAELLNDYTGKNPDASSQRDIRRAIVEAYREIANAHRWRYLYTVGRINTVAPYSTGTVVYTHSTRVLTLTTGTWPSWAANGAVLINSVLYLVESRTSDTVLVLDPVLNPGANVASTTYSISRYSYDLPADLVSIDRISLENNLSSATWMTPTEWLSFHRAVPGDSGYTSRYTIMGSPDTKGRLALFVWPFADTARTIDFIYYRRPRTLAVSEYKTGTVTTTGSDTTVTGTGTAFTSAMVGSIIRLSGNATSAPTSFIGDNPSVIERTVSAFTSATALTVDSTISTGYTGVKYAISDPIDIEEGAMLTAFSMLCRRQVGIGRIMKDKPDMFLQYREALEVAKEADQRDMSPKSAMPRSGVIWYEPTYGADE